MSYLSALETARSHLDRGDLLAAEAAFEQAHDLWRRSRVRAPLVERGLEPALRRVGGWLGRRSSRPVLPVFGHRASVLEDDLQALARLLREEALTVLERGPDGLVEADRVVLENALRLDRKSRNFSLDRPERWQALRGYLDACRRLARAVDVELLPAELAGSEDEEWLRGWCEAVLAGGGVASVELLAWIERQSSALGRLDTPDAARWSWVTARAALRDPEGGERALVAVQRALESGLEDEHDARARRMLAGLLVNESVLAGPGADVEDALARWAPKTAAHAWPPDEVRQLLAERRAVDADRAVVTVAWDDGARHLVLVLHDGNVARDALAFAPCIDAPAGTTRFEASLPEARGWIQRWLPERSLVLTTGAPPAHVADLLAGHPVLDVDALLDAIPAEGRSLEAEVPGASHPLWGAAAEHGVYRPLAERARALVPRLRAWVAACPAFSEEWGRRALDVMDEHGLELCGTLRLAVDRTSGPPESVERTLQDVDLVVPLQWPRLESREWPHASDEAPISIERDIDRTREGSLWFDRVADVDELVAIGAASERAQILTVENARAAALAARAAAHVDPRRVTVAPGRVPCPDALLSALDAWMRASVGDVGRQRDVLWLWRLLAETPSGACDVDASALTPTRQEIVHLLHDASSTCGASCRLAAHGGCWRAQLEGRREISRVWVVPVESSDLLLDDVDDLLLDDLRRFVTRVDDTGARERLVRVTDEATRSRRVWVFSRSGRLDAALRARWSDAVDRPLHQGGEGDRDAPAILLAPPGYRLGDPLLAQEAEHLLEIRAAAWRDAEASGVLRWDPRGRDGALDLPGRGPQADRVVTVRLAEADVDDPLLLLLRAAAAQAHASECWACLDARLAHAVDHAGGFHPEEDGRGFDAPGVVEAAMRSTVAEGRGLLNERGGRAPGGWAQPMTASRFEAVARLRGLDTSFDAPALASVLEDWGRGRPLVVGGATDRQRARVIDLVRELAERSGDGGPLGIRCVFVVGVAASSNDERATVVGPADEERLGAVMLEAERGRTSRVDLHPALLRNDALRAWARRVSGVVWIFPHLETAVADDAMGGPNALGAWRDVLERSGAAALAFVDEVDDAPRGSVARWATALDARTAVLPAARRIHAAWRLEVDTVGPVTVACWRCTRSIEVANAASRCPSCEALVADHPGARRAAAEAAEDALVTRLHARTPRTWWAITADAELAGRMRQRLGLEDLGAEAAPLLAAVATEPDDPRVLHVDELDGLPRPPGDLLWLDVPAHASDVRRVVQRLAAMEAVSDRIVSVLAPLGLDMATPRALRGRWRWTAKRTEVEFRLREIEARDTDGRSAVGLRPASRGPALVGALRARRGAVLQRTDEEPPRPSAVVDAIDHAGISFGSATPARLDTTRLPAAISDEDVCAMLGWAIEVGVLEGTPIRRVDPTPASTALQRRLRGIGGEGARLTEVLDAADLPGDVERRPPPPGEVRIGIGRREDAWLRDAVERAVAAGDRVLVVVGHPTGRARWQNELSPVAEAVDVEELAMAFLDNVAHERGVRGRARLLPPSGSAEGEESRLRLMRETSRRYAQATGRIPSLEAQDLRRAVQGEMRSIPSAVAADVDLTLLDRCAAEARAAAGWLTPAELREASVNAVAVEPDIVERWRMRYAWVAVDGIHDLSEPMLGFVRSLFPSTRRWETLDPLLGVDPDARTPVSARRNLETDIPRDTLRAIETLRRNEPDDVGRLRAKGRHRARDGVERVRVLTLRAAADWILENVDPERAPDRTGVVVAHEDDRRELAAALRRGGLDTLDAASNAAILADGPRHVIAALHLVVAEPRADLLDVLAALDPARATLSRDERFARWLDGDARGAEVAADVGELRLMRLHAVRGRIPRETRVADAVETLLEQGVVDDVLDLDAATGRLRDWLDDHGHRSVEDILDRVDPALVADPAAPLRAVRLLGLDELVGPDHDHLIAIGTGFEPVVRNVRILLRAPERVSLLYSERDPLA